MNIHKKYFSIYKEHPDLIYLDSAATSLTADSVCDKMNEYYSHYGVNVSRGVYALCEQATEQYESVRGKVAHFIGAKDESEIVFTSGTTHSINILAHSILSLTQNKEQHVLVTAADHHANFVPWQHGIEQKNMIQKNQASTFDVVTIDKDYQIDLEDLLQKMSSHTTLLALPYVSNVLGTINPLKEIILQARNINPQIIVVVDAAQAAPHVSINVQDLDCDFLTFSSHKIYGPTGTGILWGKKEKLEQLTPLLTGGDMIEEVSSKKTSFKAVPYRLEAGTPNIAGVIGLGKAIDFIQSLGTSQIQQVEQELTAYAISQLRTLDEITIYGPTNADNRAGVISFSLQGVHPHDIASILDTKFNISLRAGNHCAMPLHTQTLGVQATARISFGIYNTKDDINTLIKGLHKILEIFQVKSTTSKYNSGA